MEKFNTKFLAARQFISPIQAPWLSAASEGLQNRKKYNTSNICTVKKMPGKDSQNAQTSKENRKTTKKKQGNRNKQGLKGKGVAPLSHGWAP